jgi:hypothetical protein
MGIQNKILFSQRTTLFMLAVIYYENMDKYLIKKGAPVGTPINI